MTKDEQMRIKYIELALQTNCGSASLIKIAEQIKEFVEAGKAKE